MLLACIRRVVTSLALSLLMFGCALEPVDDKSRVAASTNALGAPPHPSCISAEFDDHGYWFCPDTKNRADARLACQTAGTDLVNVGSEAENVFVWSNVGLDALIGATDDAAEGTWRWSDTDSHFWTGNTFGTPVGGAYTKWDHLWLQPDNQSNQDCAVISALSGLWFDVSCSTAYWYVCEEDLCPEDNSKSAPGQCGCGAPDTDSDGDGTADCLDECPADPNHVVPGHCGCVGEDNLAPAGTPCQDGYCSANDECNGAGICGSISECAPSGGNCTTAVFDGHAYAFCKNDRNFDDARDKCQSVRDTDLVHIESSSEDTFVHDNLVAPAWIGADDREQEGKWQWVDDDSQFWSGGALGNPVGGGYQNWYALQPDNHINQDCAAHKKHSNGWIDESCLLLYDYVCESLDLCPNDPSKLSPGDCGCGNSDQDTDGDSVADCLDDCPFDPTQTTEGPDGCTQPSCTGSLDDLRPTFECILDRDNGEPLAIFGVKNTSACVVDVPLGEDNEFLDGAPFRGQPTRFLPGYTQAVAFPLDGTVTWVLGDRRASATPGGPACQHTVERGDAPIILTGTKDHDVPGDSVVDESEISGGQAFTLPERLPVTLGNASNGEAELTYRGQNGVLVTCTYRGGASTATPNSDLERARGRSYHFESCDNGAVPGAQLVGTEWTLEVISGDPRITRTRVETHLGPGCSGLLEPPISPEDTVTMRQSFDWLTTTALPTTDSTGLPALRYALIYVESREQVDSLRQMGIYYSQLPIFASDLARYQGKCGVLDNSGDLQGLFLHALVPAAAYNLWREASINIINSTGPRGIPFRAVILPSVPEPAMANPDGTVSWQALKASGFDYTKQRALQQPFFGIDIPIVDDAIEIVGGALIGGTVGATIVAAVQIGEEVFETEISIIPTLDDIVEATANVVDAVTQGVQEVIGAFDEFFSGSVSVPLNFEVLNRDPAFGTDLVMRRAWGPGIGNELALRGAEVEILQTLGIGIVTSHTDEMDGWGLTTVSVAEGTEFRGLCVHLENDAAMISHGITENSFCDFSNSYAFGDFEEPYREARKAAPRTGFVYRVSHRYWNYLAQLTDSYDFARRVIDHEPKQAEVAVGAVANLIGENQDPGPRAFVGCFDYTEMSNTLTATAGAGAVLSSFAGGVATAAGGLGLFAQPFIAKDIFFPSGSSADASRNTATHEYGHFVMCDILADESGALVDLYVQRAIGEGLGENADDETGISIETFADLFASQVNGGVNYIAFSEAETSESNDFCSDSTSYSCLEQNYRNDTSELPVEADAYHAAIRRLVSLAHDALDRPDDDWRTQNVPTNGDHWMLSGGTLPLVPNTMASWNLRDNDDQLAMSGPGLRDWIFRCAGGGIDTDELVGALAEELLEGHSWCRVCPVFAAHDPDVSAMATLQEQWIACRDGLIVDALSSPPNAALRLDAATCSECPAREISDASGACTPCPGDRDVVVGNACVACPSGQVAVGDTCVSCAANEITSGNACQACTALRVADRTTNTCVDCPADAVLDAATFVPEVTCGDAFVDVASLTTPGDLCPDTFWLQVNNVDALGDGEPLQSRLAFGAFGYGPLTSGGDCSGSAAFNFAWTNTDTNGVVSFGTDSLTDDGTLCAPTGVPTCYEPCVYTFPSSGEFAFLSRSELQNEVTSVFRVGIAVDAGSPLVELFANASALCPDPY